MNAQLKSFTTSETQYRVTIDERQGVATDCGCPDRQYRHRECKHMREFNQEVQRAATFILLQRMVQEKQETARAWREYAEMA